MSINARHLRELVVMPALAELGERYASPAAVMLMMLTAAVETDCGLYLRQNGTDGGWAPGRGVWSVEPATFKYVQSVWPELLVGEPDDMVTDLKLAAKAARLKYWSVPAAMPPADLEALARYWKRYYNASPRGATWQEAVAKYRKYVG